MILGLVVQAKEHPGIDAVVCSMLVVQFMPLRGSLPAPRPTVCHGLPAPTRCADKCPASLRLIWVWEPRPDCAGRRKALADRQTEAEAHAARHTATDTCTHGWPPFARGA